MQYRNLGRTGLKVSQLSYGAWVSFGNQVDVKEAKGLLQCCRDHGVNFFDNAEVPSGSSGGGVPIWWFRPKSSGAAAGPTTRGSRASTSWRAPRPRSSASTWTMSTCSTATAPRRHAAPIEETVRAMNYVIDSGWAFYWGNQRVVRPADHRGLGCRQPASILVGPVVEVEYLPLYSNYGIGLTTWSPLASGVLTGKYSKGNIPADSRLALENYKNLASRSLVDDVLRKVNGLKPIADELGVPLAQLSIAWCALNPNVSSVITGATKEEPGRIFAIIENMKAINVIPLLTPDVIEKIEAVVQSKPKRADSYR
ncbi:unnamed protein product [Spirodela intermedia]|uniref:NADP-dependent oxidoreductase domain-containing protein n=1 Tax=Spirodela intermedia TaxID=51605 RepID=A0A7I8IX48_SPIIN|nr:unnamed protein product [Spirodela intermedia]CAA6662576.1 unnamed protein product [Spirodela intermedia]